MATKKSAFDVLMNKINKKEDSKPRTKDLKKEKPKPKDNENDIILITNEPVQNEKENSPRKRLPSFKIDPLHLQHVQQHTDEDKELLKSFNCNNFKFKPDTDPVCLPITIDLNSPLTFDFTRHDSKINEMSLLGDPLDVTYSVTTSIEFLNNRVNDTITEENTSLNTSLNDTLNDTDFNISSSHLDSPSSIRSRQSKRRKTENRSTRRVLQTDSDKTNQLWTEKYQFKNEKDIVTNKSQCERLKDWLSNWKSILSKTVKYTDGDESDSDFSVDSDFSTDSSSSLVNGRKFYSNAILLSGPHGSGKTSSVYSIAKQLGFKIFEVNASSLRNKSQIIQELDGALNSHHVSNNSKSKIEKDETNKFKMDKFFNTAQFNKKPKLSDLSLKKPKKRKNSLRREVVLSNCMSNESIIELDTDPQVNIHKESLILFDEIDVVFKEDVGFWGAVNHFIKRSKKPIVLTTSDDFLQEKVNLNIEKVEFMRPRIDAAVRFLKDVAHSESTRLDTSTAYKILQECKCDMRRALFQLQALVTSEKTVKRVRLEQFDLNRFFKNDYLIDGLIYLDFMTTRILRLLQLESGQVFNKEQPVNFKRYDLMLLRDGLTDNSSNQAFNPFMLQSGEVKSREDLTKLNTTFLKEDLNDYFWEYFKIINGGNELKFSSWCQNGEVGFYNYTGNVSMNRLAQGLYKFTSNKSLSLDYRPYLHEICKLEERKQKKNLVKRRYMHYLSNLSIGLIKEDYGLLVRSSLDEEIEENCDEGNNEHIFDPNIFSNE